MLVRQIICIALAALVGGCASWHRPDLAYSGRPVKQRVARPVFPDWEPDDVPIPKGPQLISPGNSTLTPPIEGTSQRTSDRPLMSRAIQSRETGDEEFSERLKRRSSSRPLPKEGPGSGYLELPPPPETSSRNSR